MTTAELLDHWTRQHSTGSCSQWCRSPPVRFLEPLQCQDEQLGVVLVVERREGDGREAPALQPVHNSGVDSNSLFWGDIGAVLRRRGRGRRRNKGAERFGQSNGETQTILD